MKAIRLHAFGDADQLRLEDAPIPVPAANEVLVRIVAAGVNPADWKIRSGRMAAAFPVKTPATLGWDGAGVVAGVGAEVTRFAPGDAVFFFADFAHGGTYAEYVAVDAAQLARKPRTLAFAAAAAVPTPAQAAWRAVVDVAQVAPGMAVLVHGAGGPLGSVAVQLAKRAGARVVATAGADSIDIARAAGADEVIDYRRERFEQRVREMDVVVDTVGAAVQEASWATLRRGGLLVATAVPPAAGRAAAAGVRAEMILTPPRGDVLERIAGLVDAGELRVAVSHEFALADAARVHALGERGELHGKIVLHVGAPA